MTLDIVSILILALFVEAVVQGIKPIFDKGAKKLAVWELVSIALGILIAVLAKINLLDFVQADSTVLLYVLYVMTGISLGRGPSFVHDLWAKIREIK